MFDTIGGLPVHVLALHATVVLLPLMSVVTFAVAVMPRWRRGAAMWVAAVDLGLVALTYATIESGEVLQGRLSVATGSTVAEDHGEKGALMIYGAIALFVVALIVAMFARQGGLAAGIAILLAGVVGAGVIGWTVIVGDTGARAVWEDVVENTDPPSG